MPPKKKIKLVNPLNTEFFSLEISFSLSMPLTHRISICVKADSKTEPNSTSSLSKQTRDLNHAPSLASMQWSALSIGKHPLRAQEAFPARNEPPDLD